MMLGKCAPAVQALYSGTLAKSQNFSIWNSSNLALPALAPVDPDPLVSACDTPNPKERTSNAFFFENQLSVVSPSGWVALPVNKPPVAAAGNHKKLSAAIQILLLMQLKIRARTHRRTR